MTVPSPLGLLRDWIEEAKTRGFADYDAMVLCTVDAARVPNARVVLCRRVDERGLAFYTNYESVKGTEIAAYPQAAATFYWGTLFRQVRVRGALAKLPDEDSDAYFAQRPRGHQLGAWASNQSRQIASIDEVRDRHAAFEREFEGRPVPRPPHWGGYQLTPDEIEFWVAGADRLHTRSHYTRRDGSWSVVTLSP